jgi:hypothetical protein
MRYRPVCVSFLQTVLASVVPILMSRTFTKGNSRTYCISIVIRMEVLRPLRCFKEFCNLSGQWGQTTYMLCTQRSQSDGWIVQSQGSLSQKDPRMSQTTGDRELPIAGSTYHPPENMWFSNKFSATNEGLNLQNRRFHQCVVLMELISDDS